MKKPNDGVLAFVWPFTHGRFSKNFLSFSVKTPSVPGPTDGVTHLPNQTISLENHFYPKTMTRASAEDSNLSWERSHEATVLYPEWRTRRRLSWPTATTTRDKDDYRRRRERKRVLMILGTGRIHRKLVVVDFPVPKDDREPYSSATVSFRKK